ncbi:nuclear transport factor 2 family protein [Comamonadaceae bacterium G21597-S1]|nr:nuclear transport factor 2 family protein [Comamonadaceae bacterium G21597-S1]
MNEHAQDSGSDTDEQMFERVLVGECDREILQIEARLRAAQLTGDFETLSQLIADDLLFVGPDGNLATKNMDIESHRSGLVKFLRHEPLELHMRRPSADIAVASLTTELSVSVDGQVHQGVYRYMRVWHNKAGVRWQVLAGQVGLVNR